VDTDGKISLFNLTVESPNVIFGVKYQPSAPDICEAALKTLPIQPEEFCFVDLGAGKGRVLLIASVLPFKRLIGVEFAKELVKVARKNLMSCDRAEIVCADAADYDFPDENLVVYMYNPFERPVMERVISRLVKAAESKPGRRVYVIYHVPRELDIIQKCGMEVARLPDTAIYQISNSPKFAA
jgi:predicted RNA methylase